MKKNQLAVKLTGSQIEDKRWNYQTLSDLKPKTIASMHGSTYVGDGESTILDLAQAMKDVYG